MKKFMILIVIAFVLPACGTATPPAESRILKVYATSAASPWLTKLYACAANSSVVLKVSAESPEIYLRVGEPNVFVSSVYKVGEEEILVVVPRNSPVRNLTLAETQELFAKGSSSSGSVQVLVYPSDADVQTSFDQLVMKGRRVSSSAKVAVSPQNMFDQLNSESAAIGIMPRQWLTGDVREVFSAGRVPVLAITKSEPQGAVIGLISCLQNN
jgi:hypothetical protein